MYENIFWRIIESSRTHSLTFFVGAGVSALSNAPKWSDLLDDICTKIDIEPKGKYSSDESLQIPQVYYCSINKDNNKYYSYIQSLFNKCQLQPNEIHKKIFDLNPASIITTNFDSLLENSATEFCKGYRVIACDDEIPNINGNKFILKLHGDFEHRNIVFKEEDYLNYSENFKLIETILKSVFSTNTVVFIGYGLNDYNIKLILNWTKSLLKDKFNKPIFIYTDENELSSSELEYQEDKGLTVIQYQKLLNSKMKICFLDRYRTVLDAINNASKLNVTEKSDYELLNILYELTKPLNRFDTLRTQDLQKQLYPYAIVEEDGTIIPAPNEINILKVYIEISEMDAQEKKQLSAKIRRQFAVITSVFSKSRVRQYKTDNAFKGIQGVSEQFADTKCVRFDFHAMRKFVRNDYNSQHSNLRKAYYLAKLNLHEKALALFLEVAKESYRIGDYHTYYLAQVNRNNLISAIKSINRSIGYLNYYDLKGIEKDEKVFEELPINFQVEYANFKDLNSINLLYKNSYESFVEGKKLSDSIESNTFELGFTSSDKVICRINNNLHFLLGNGIYVDEFTEFKNTIKNLMSLLVYKYSVQNKDYVNDDMFFRSNQSKISFDEIDFYCFVEYLNHKEIENLFKKHQIDEIKFADLKAVEQSIYRLCSYYEFLVKNSATAIEVLPLELKIKNCISLIKYVDVSQASVDYICKFLFKYEFREIHIDDKILFLDSQVHHRKKYSDITRKIISNKLFYYMDMEIESIKENKQFELLSTHTGINYSNLIYYIEPIDKTLCSRRLALRISGIIKNKYRQMYKSICGFYFEYLSANQKAVVIKWIKIRLQQNFDFESFAVLIQEKVRIDNSILALLDDYLKTICNAANNKLEVQMYPKTDKYSDLINVGYWIHIGLLPKDKFNLFVGINDNFDFYYQYDKFDFDKFNVKWLFNLHPNTYKAIIKNQSVKDIIRNKISEVLVSKELNNSDQKRLSDLLLKWFC